MSGGVGVEPMPRAGVVRAPRRIVKMQNTVRTNHGLSGGGFEGDPGTADDDDPDLWFVADRRCRYFAEWQIDYRASSTADLRVLVSGPEGATGIVRQHNLAAGASSYTAQNKLEVEALRTGARMGGVDAEGVATATIRAVLTIGGVGGKVALRWGQATPEASDATVYALSMLTYELLGVA